MINKKQQSGVGLIEVLITALILGGSLMALTALQSRSLQFNHIAYTRSQANIVAYDAVERIRVRSSATQLVNLDQTDLDDLAEDLPDGEVTSDCNGARICTITVTWSEAYGGDDDAASEAEFVYVSRI